MSFRDHVLNREDSIKSYKKKLRRLRDPNKPVSTFSGDSVLTPEERVKEIERVTELAEELEEGKSTQREPPKPDEHWKDARHNVIMVIENVVLEKRFLSKEPTVYYRIHGREDSVSFMNLSGFMSQSLKWVKLTQAEIDALTIPVVSDKIEIINRPCLGGRYRSLDDEDDKIIIQCNCNFGCDSRNRVIENKVNKQIYPYYYDPRTDAETRRILNEKKPSVETGLPSGDRVHT